MGFSSFHGNTATVTRVREMIARDRLPHAVIFAGPRGAGKYTLAQMAAKAMNCLEPPAAAAGLADFCGRCSNCLRIAQADDLDARFAEAVEAREGLKDADKKDTRVLVQTHPDVLVIPPDPPQMMIKVGQVRHVIENIYYKPQEGRERVFIFTSTAFIREAENSLLKVLEEPPEFATIFLLAENPGELLPTIRSRCVTLTLGALPVVEIEAYLASSATHDPSVAPKQRALVARLAQGAIGRARNFDLAGYITSRTDALALLRSAIGGEDHSALFRVTETYRAGAEGKGKTDQLLRALYLLLEDLMFAKSGTTELIRNIDIAADLARMAQSVTFDWIAEAARGLTEVERGMRRNLLRSLSLDAFAVGLER